MGGNKVGKNKYDEWYVVRDSKKERAKGNGKELLEEVIVGQERYYGKGRNKYSTAKEQILDEFDKQEVIDNWTRLGIWDPNMSEDEARFSAVRLGTELLLPNPILKSATIAVNTKREISWIFGAFKSEAKWAGQLTKRGWTVEQITEAVTKGKSFDAVNMVNKGNSATRFVHPRTGKSVVIDNVTKELLQVGGEGFVW